MDQKILSTIIFNILAYFCILSFPFSFAKRVLLQQCIHTILKVTIKRYCKNGTSLQTNILHDKMMNVYVIKSSLYEVTMMSINVIKSSLSEIISVMCRLLSLYIEANIFFVRVGYVLEIVCLLYQPVERLPRLVVQFTKKKGNF